jgi:hypothetical protein
MAGTGGGGRRGFAKSAADCKILRNATGAVKAGVDRLSEYVNLAEYLTEVSFKEELAECARLLAMNVAHHKQKFGEVSVEE